MQILALDIGTGTQDILLFDSEQVIENCPKLVAPSPTAIIAQRIAKATAARRSLVLIGTNMGGGPSSWAVRRHLEEGLAVYSLPEAARTIDDDLEAVQQMGIKLISQDEAAALAKADQSYVVELRDYDGESIARAFAAVGVEVRPDAVALAVLDHGDAPAGYSDRRFRFEYLQRQVQQDNTLAAFAHLRDEIPPEMTRMQAAADSVPVDTPVLVMDTPAAAVMGSLGDPEVARHTRLIAVNLGNSHTLAFHLQDGTIAGMFEHHTGALTPARLDELVIALGRGELRNEDVFAENGHGALIARRLPGEAEFRTVTGPRRGMARQSALSYYFAVPYGDMMLAGCFGLLRALAVKEPQWAPAIEKALGN